MTFDLTSFLSQIRNVVDYQLVLRFAVLLIVVFITHIISKRIIIRGVAKVFEKTRIHWDDLLIQRRVVHLVVRIIPAAVLYHGLEYFPRVEEIGRKLIVVYIVILILFVIDKLLTIFLDVYATYTVSQKRPLKGYVQLLKIILYIIGGIFLISFVINKSPWGLISGIGALTAVLMLIFKDTILSFVAGIQIAGNDLLQKGDWIEIPDFGVDGAVIDVALHTVKVQNWDKTIVAVPTHKFLDHTFKNWRGMIASGGRRMKRSVYIDQSSIGFASEELIKRAEVINILEPYLKKKVSEIQHYNASIHNKDVDVNKRRITNIGLFRAYLQAYLENHSHVRKDMTLMVRQLQPEADAGLPFELYAFLDTVAWVEFEGIQADIFDHILAVIPFFDLKAYQREAHADERGYGTRLMSEGAGDVE